VRRALSIAEIGILSALILAARCANYQDVFVSGNVYFTDADCYARMTRVRICEQHPGWIVRHHEFENFPAGTTPHTTAPLDYLIIALSILLKPFTGHAIDLAGALISPLVALLGGWFLWWWSRRMRFCYRWIMLIFYAISPILVHGTELGRPDHQSLLMLLVTIGICAEWTLRIRAGETPIRLSLRAGSAAMDRNRWSMVSGIAWGLAVWVSTYEPLVLLLLLLACHAVAARRRVIDRFRVRRVETAAQSPAEQASSAKAALAAAAGSGSGGSASASAIAVFGKHRRIGWICFALIIALALLLERRIPSLPVFASGEIFKNWSRTIGELAHVSPLDPIWFHWMGWTLIGLPFLIWLAVRKGNLEALNGCALTMTLILLGATYFLTIWQARWAYFFMSIFAIVLPSLLEPMRSRVLVWVAFILSIFPILHDWDEKIWPNESEYARRMEHRHESIELRELALNLMSSGTHSFLAPWWLSPEIAYWSGQPGVAGSSHESLDGSADSARFYLAEDFQEARQILENHQVTWVFGYDAERTAQNSAAVLGKSVAQHGLCYVLDRAPGQASRFLVLLGQNGTAKLFRVANNR
jgi:hypothetical protein